MTFTLDRRLAESSTPVAALDLCDARLQLDARYPWIVLIPRQQELREFDDLDPATLGRLMQEITAAGRAVRAVGAALGSPIEKLNVGALGNIVAQLHIHVVGRRRHDAAWPGPVWGLGEAAAYAKPDLECAVRAAAQALGSYEP